MTWEKICFLPENREIIKELLQQVFCKIKKLIFWKLLNVLHFSYRFDFNHKDIILRIIIIKPYNIILAIEHLKDRVLIEYHIILIFYHLIEITADIFHYLILWFLPHININWIVHAFAKLIKFLLKSIKFFFICFKFLKLLWWGMKILSSKE
jgi:hypothetical protein